ncbi:MAG: LolA family protein [Syntrophomonadaceae bacterium]
MKKIILLLIIFSAGLYAQNQDPVKLLEKVKQKFSQVNDYEVNAHIKVDVSFLKVPEMDAKIYFMKPDKMKLDTEGFAMLPKQAFNFSPDRLFKGDYSAIYVKKDNLGGTPVDVVKVIPNDPNSEIVLSTLWIDSGKDVIRKIESTPRRGGAFEITFNYNNNMNYPLPSSVQFSFDAPNNPRGMNSPGSQQQQPKAKTGQSERGNVSVTYTNYKVNKGIPDGIFSEKKKK